MGCATTGVRLPRPDKISFIELGTFCKKYKLDYKYLPFYEEIILSDNMLNIQLRPDVSFALINNTPKNIYKPVTYNRGKVLVPSSLEFFIANLKKVTSKRLTSLIPIELERIVIDPGHGGRDPGAISPRGFKEKDVNLRIALHLKKLLKQRGFRVFLTRDRDVFISLKDRVRFSRRKRADLFISIHANANRSRRLRGLEVYYLSPKFSDTQSKVLATAENMVQQEGLNLPAGLKKIVGEMLNIENRRETLELASAMMKEADNMGIYTRKTIGAPFYVLKYNVCPAVLVEVGYLTNREEERLLRTSLYKKQIALALAEGVSRLRENLGRRTMVAK